MRTLIIPDLHHHTANADYWLRTQKYDRVILLGDFFDDFGDDVNDARRTATWLRKRMESSDDVFLLGNHDAPYMFPGLDALYCPGFTKAKAAGINEILQPKHWQRLKLAHFEQGWLLSHAGFCRSLMKVPDVKDILNLCEQALEKGARGVFDPLLGAGCDRGGNLPCGGPLWIDWNSLVPITGINQIVGHTPGAEVRRRSGERSENYCLDVRNGAAAAILEGGRISIFRL